jgi:hypothetical protein
MTRPRLPVAFRGVALLVLCGPILAGCIFGIPLLPYSTPSSSPGPSMSTISPSPGPTAQPPPLVSGEPLSKAPGAAVWNLADDGSIQISAWQSGRPLRTILEIPRPDGGGRFENLRVSAAPTGNLFAIIQTVESDGLFADEVRVFTKSGELSWTQRLRVQGATARWAPDGTRLVIDAPLTWLTIGFADGRPPTVREIATDRPRQPNGMVTYPWMLIGFSENGRLLYGAEDTAATPWFRPGMRVAAIGGPIEPIQRLPTAKGVRLASSPIFGGSRIAPAVDPVSGSIVTWVCGYMDACRVNLWRDRTGAFFDLPSGATSLDMAWNRGTLIGLWRQQPAEGDAFRLSEFEAKGQPGAERRITSLPFAGNGGSLVGLSDGFALVGLGSGIPTERLELVLVRLSDGARSVVQSAVDATDVEKFGFAGWLPSAR